MSILALDLGTNTGHAVDTHLGILSGTSVFGRGKKDHPGARWSAYRAWLSNFVEVHRVSLIAYEDVRRHNGQLAGRCYGALLAMTEMVAQQHNVPLVAYGVGTIKRAWTGKGTADKADMIAEARRRGFDPEDDNAADALAILHLAIQLRAKEAA